MRKKKLAELLRLKKNSSNFSRNIPQFDFMGSTVFRNEDKNNYI